MANIIWQSRTDAADNTIWEGDSPYHDDDGYHFRWGLRQALAGNQIVWFEAHDQELGEGGEVWQTLKEAMAACQKAHDHIIVHELENAHG